MAIQNFETPKANKNTAKYIFSSVFIVVGLWTGSFRQQRSRSTEDRKFILLLYEDTQ